MAKYATLGSMNIKKDLDTKNRKAYCIKIPKDTIITVNGRKVEGDYINVERPTDKFDRMLAKGSITQAEYEKKCADYDAQGKLSFVQFEITAKTEE
jgi:flagellar basal body rod protein FlgF